MRHGHPLTATACVLLLATLALGWRGAGPIAREPPEARTLRGRVFDSQGEPVAARLQRAPLRTLACPCGGAAKRLDAPACRCDAAVREWVRLLDACGAPAPDGLPTEADGRFSLAWPEPEGLLWASGADGGTALRVGPDLGSDVSLTLRPLEPIQVELDLTKLFDVPGMPGPDRMATARAALIAPDGTCQPLTLQPHAPGALDIPYTFVSPPAVEAPWAAVIDIPGADLFSAVVLPDGTQLVAPEPRVTMGGSCWKNSAEFDEERHPAVGAHVTLKVDGKVLRTRTNVAGSFTFTNVPLQPMRFECGLQGRRATQEVLPFLSVHDVELILGQDRGTNLEPQVVISVTEPGRGPLQDAQVSLFDMDTLPSGPMETGHTTSWGEYRKSGMLAGRYAVLVDAPRARGADCAGTAEREFTVAEQGGARVELTLRLKPVDLKPLRGRIVAADGTPVAGASVSLSPQGERTCSTGELDNQESRADGTFTFPAVASGLHQLTVRHPWFRYFETQVRRTPERVDLRLDPGAKLAGTVLLPGGQPARVCSVWVRTELDHEHFTQCDAAGRFTLRALSKGPHRMTVFAGSQPGNPQERGEDLVWSPSVLDGVNPLTVTFQPGDATLQGQVTRANGAPAANAWVRVNVERADASVVGTLFVSTQTDGDGRFVLTHLPSGRWKVTAYQGSLSAPTVTVALPGDAPPLSLRLKE